MNTIEKALNVISTQAQEQNLIPDEVRMTLPTLKRADRENQTVQVGFHLGQTRPNPQEPRKIYFPFLAGEASVPNLEVNLYEIYSDDFGIILPAGEYIGDLGELKRFDVKTYLELRNGYYSLLSDVADKNWLVKIGSNSEEAKATAHNITKILQKISEKALEPYYKVAGRDLRTWLSDCGFPFQP